ncbi:Pyruvate/Phosphoenolpyruvate kinase-like domain-containing protein [Chaetomidium leptoderma]|uniref:Pyruvate/Phosphoenolpyruvate kinase-like domain-containing protein n=1 Tax=Chaetomidium leptoderma TaxID=669021 RepID=A0AAN6VXY2_9PEZI|nr:Pyruvate/Phosphoenolpyruvate kinase-like domain-containing protein [Chaetomidium leptoderma]
MASSTLPALRRALLYVPASSPRFLAKSLTLTSDNVTYDLEDSVTASMKPAARTALQEHLTSLSSRKETTMSEIAVRINAVSTPDALADIAAVAALPALDTLVIPKVNSAADLLLVEDAIRQAAPDRASSSSSRPIKLLALIESARAIMDLRAICAATPNLRGLIFAAEDFALDLSLRRSPRMREMLYARSAIVTAARAYRLESVIDAVCTRLSDPRQPQRQLDECRNGSGMGFNGKQCIHPAQVPIVQHLFSPDKTKIKQATRIVVADEKASAAGRGAWSLDGRMIDAPVVGKARAILARAKQCGIDVDAVREKFKDQNFE